MTQLVGKPGERNPADVQDTTNLPADTVSISSLANQAMQTPGIRQDKVEALRQTISNGTYQVDAGKIAEAILRDKS